MTPPLVDIRQSAGRAVFGVLVFGIAGVSLAAAFILAIGGLQ